MKKIIGISLVKNEDIYVRRSIENVVNFCDKLIVLDNNSTDNTYGILQDLNNEYDNIDLHKITNYKTSHEFIDEYIGKDAWVFGVDGDEIYDKQGLTKFRTKLLSGMYDDKGFNIKGPSFHCCEDNNPYFTGYMDDVKSVCKLYNFSLIERWQTTERLHNLEGSPPAFKDSVPYSVPYYLNLDRDNWDNADFKCLHLCFVQRSSEEKDKDSSNGRPCPHSDGKNKAKRYKSSEKITIKIDFA